MRSEQLRTNVPYQIATVPKDQLNTMIRISRAPLMRALQLISAVIVAFGTSAIASEPAKKTAKLVGAANAFTACLTPLAHEADETAARMRKSRFNHLERQIANDKRKYLAGKPDAFSAAVMIDNLARAAGLALYFNSDTEIKVAQCIEAACPALDDPASDGFYGRAFTCRQSAAGLRQRIEARNK